MPPSSMRVAERFLQKRADSDGSYMSVQSLQSLHDHAATLLQKIRPGTRLPDWVESKIDRSAAALLDVMEYMEHGEGALSPDERGF